MGQGPGRKGGNLSNLFKEKVWKDLQGKLVDEGQY